MIKQKKPKKKSGDGPQIKVLVKTGQRPKFVNPNRQYRTPSVQSRLLPSIQPGCYDESPINQCCRRRWRRCENTRPRCSSTRRLEVHTLSSMLVSRNAATLSSMRAVHGPSIAEDLDPEDCVFPGHAPTWRTIPHILLSKRRT
jgi:hypothetical protein